VQHCSAYDWRTSVNCCRQNVRETSAHLSLTNKVSKLLTAAATTTTTVNKQINKKTFNRIKETRGREEKSNGKSCNCCCWYFKVNKWAREEKEFVSRGRTRKAVPRWIKMQSAWRRCWRYNGWNILAEHMSKDICTQETDVCVCVTEKEKEVPHRPIKRKRFETRVSHCLVP